MFKCYPEPVKLIGEGEYNLNDLKEIKVTESYLGLHDDIRVCSTEGSIHNCTTRHYIDTLLSQCGCLPFNLVPAEKVNIKVNNKAFEDLFYLS